MGLFEDTVVKAKDVFDVAAKKTNEVISLQKLKIKVSQTNSLLANDFEALGRIFYEKSKNSDEISSEYKELFESIDQKFRELESLEEEIDAQKKTKVCKGCGHKNPTEAEFCNKCGNKL